MYNMPGLGLLCALTELAAMSLFKTKLDSCNALSVLREHRDGEKRFLCYTAYCEAESVWQIG